MPNSKKDPKVVYRANDTMFYNSQCIFIEYMDILKTPWFVLLNLSLQNPKLREILDTSQVDNFSLESLFEWYVNRKNRNIFYELSKYKDLDIETADKIVEDQLKISPIFFDTDTTLNLVPSVKKIMRQDFVKKVIVYNEYYNEYMDKDIHRMFGQDSKFVHGDINEVLNGIPIDTTYFFSDANKIIALDDTNHLEYSSVVLPIEYRYNKKNKTDWIIDFNYLGKEKLFKLAYFSACTREVGT